MRKTALAKFTIGQVVRHRLCALRGVVFDVDPEFSSSDEWYQAIPPETRPRKDQPFYHLFAEDAETELIAYISEQNLVLDLTGEPVRHTRIEDVFMIDAKGAYRPRKPLAH